MADLFEIDETLVGSIPPVQEVVLPPEAVRAQKLRRALMIIVAVVLALCTCAAIWYFVAKHRRETAVLRAGDLGTRAAVDAGIAHLEANEPLALRLQAQRAYLGDGDLNAIREQLQAQEAHPDASSRLTALTYLALANGDVQSALQHINSLLVAGTYAGETAHVLSLVHSAVGATETALTHAATAVELRPDASRYRANLALAKARHGDFDGALADVSNPTSTFEKLALIRAATMARRFDDVPAQVTSLLEDPLATPGQKGWAHAAVALMKAAMGERAGATTAARAALETPPLGDELFKLSVAEAFLRAGDASAAAPLIQSLTSARSADPERRGRAIAWLSLIRGDATSARQTLEQAGSGPDTVLLRALLEEKDGAHDAARALYAQAADDPRTANEARGALAAMELSLGQGERALAAVAPVLASMPDHPEFGAVAVRANAVAGKLEEASALATTLIEAHPDDVRVLSAKSIVHLAREEWGPALSTLQRAVELAPADPVLHAQLGDAARESDELDISLTAYTRALELAPTHQGALVGMLQLRLARNEIAAAKDVLTQIDAAPIRSHGIEALRAEYLVHSGAGLAGTRRVMQGIRSRNRRVELRVALAELYMQGERYNLARGMFGRIHLFGGDRVAAELGRALAYIRENRLAQAVESLEEARNQAGREEGSTEDPLADNPRALVVRARVALFRNENRDAKTLAERALELRPGYGEALLILGECAMRRRRDPNDLLRQAATTGLYPQPWAAGLLARRLRNTEDGCDLARRYRRAAPGGEHHKQVTKLIKACGR